MQLILTTPTKFDANQFLDALISALQTGLVPVVLVRQTDLAIDEYKQLVQTIVPLCHRHDCAVLLDDQPDLVRRLDADGVQITTGHKDVLNAIKSLKPDFIVGAANLNSRHQAMLCGEAGADYLAFGDFTLAPNEQSLALTDWWAKLFEVPGALFDQKSPLNKLPKTTSEFFGLGDNLWHSTTPIAQVIRQFQPEPQEQ